MMTSTRAAALIALAAGSLALVGCGSPAPAVPAVDLGRAATQSDVSKGTTPVAGTDGEYDVPAGDAAAVRLGVSGGGIGVLDLLPAQGWRQVEDERRPAEIDMTFVRDATTVTLDAEIDDGRFETDVDIDAPATPGTSSYDVSGAGRVTIEVAGDRVLLVGQEATAGWVATVDEQELAEGEVEIRFRNDGESRTVDFDADIDDRELTVTIDSRTGRDYAAPPVR